MTFVENGFRPVADALSDFVFFALPLAVALPVAVPSGLLPEPVQQTADNPSRQVRVVLQSPWEAQ